MERVKKQWSANAVTLYGGGRLATVDELRTYYNTTLKLFVALIRPNNLS